MPDPFLPQHDHRDRRLLLLTVGRLAVATLLLSGTLYLVVVSRPWVWSFTPLFLAVLIGMTYAIALASAVWLRWSPNVTRISKIQIAADLLFTSGMVYATGGTSSGFTFLYGVAVLMAAIVAGPRVARFTGASAIALYLAMSIGFALGWLPPPADQRTEAYALAAREMAYSGALNVVGLLLVTLLSSALAARLQTTGGLLRAAEQGMAELARLNNDIVRSLTSGLVTTDLTGRIRLINPIGQQMLHITDSQTGADVRTLLPLDGPLDEATTQNESRRREAVATRIDGTTFPIGYSVTPLVSAQGVVDGWIIIFQDLTEITQLREVAERSERLASLGRLSAGLAHEIRNPLSSIAGSVELVRESPHLDDEERRLLGIVLTESERLNDLVSTMLQVGRPTDLRRMETNVVAVAQEVVTIAQRERSEVHGLQIRCAPSPPVTAWVDEDQLRQVLWNLLKNAMQASPVGSKIDVLVEDHGDTVTLAVADEGAGIDPAQRDRIFDLFYSERTHGVGIGLALVRQIVEAHGGTIAAESNPTRGATFRVTLPKRPSNHGSHTN